MGGGSSKDASAKGQKSAPMKKKRTNAKAAKKRTKAKAAPVPSTSLDPRTKSTKKVRSNAAATKSRLVEEVTEAETSVTSYEMSIGETAKGECVPKPNTHSTTAQKKTRSDASGTSRGT